MSGKQLKRSKVQKYSLFDLPNANQTMPCDWREGALGSGHHSVQRKRRSAGNITAVQLPDQLVEDEDEDDNMDLDDRAPKSLGNFSESLNLFQSIQVLANEEEERAFMNETASSKFEILFVGIQFFIPISGVLVDEADFCFSSMIFTSAVAGITTLLIISGLSISLLCARVRRHDKGGRESARDVVHTLRFHF